MREHFHAALLLVDDDEPWRNVLSRRLKREGFHAIGLGDARQIEATLASGRCSLALVDLHMPEVDGIAATSLLKRIDPSIEVVVMTGQGTVETAVACLRAGADDYLEKGIGLPELVARIHKGLERRRARESRAALDAAEKRCEGMRIVSHGEDSWAGAGDAVLVVDASNTIVEWSGAAARMFGWSHDEACGQPYIELMVPREDHEETRKKAVIAFAEWTDPNSVHRFVGRRLRRDGSALEVEVLGVAAPTSDRMLFAIQFRDLAAHRHADMELRQSQKLEAVGRLAAGVAHEINTPVQFIGDSAHFLVDAFQSVHEVMERLRAVRDAVACGEPATELAAQTVALETDLDVAYLEQQIPLAAMRAIEGVKRVATIVAAMKSFAHPGGGQMSPADLNKAVGDTLVVAANELKYVADVIVELGEIPPVTCHLSDVNQVLLNLVVNAAHAVTEKGPARGEIRVTTRVEGDDVVIEVCDTGPGIPEEIRSKVFEPFFTTKEVGRGTGQGLALARRVIVEGHQGSLTFDSTVGMGTTFKVRLPIAPADVKTPQHGEGERAA